METKVRNNSTMGLDKGHINNNIPNNRHQEALIVVHRISNSTSVGIPLPPPPPPQVSRTLKTFIHQLIECSKWEVNPKLNKLKTLYLLVSQT